jgi:hypothetical protein
LRSPASGWTEAKDSAVIHLYRSLSTQERHGLPVDINRAILATTGIDKTPGAIRMRLANVSAILEERRLARVSRLSPLRHYPRQLARLVDASLPW